MRFGFREQIKEETMQYLHEHTDPKDCTVSKMIRGEGCGVRKTAAVSRRFFKKHLDELEERGYVFSMLARDPVRKIEFRFYTLRPKSNDPHQPIPKCFGVPKQLQDVGRALSLKKYIWDVYTNIAVYGHEGFVSNFCNLCNEFQKVLEEKLDCYKFYRLWHGSLDELKNMGISMSTIEELKRKKTDWEEYADLCDTEFIQWLFEGMTFSLFKQLQYGRLTFLECGTCSKYSDCLSEGKKWFSDFHTTWPGRCVSKRFFEEWKSIDSDLARFWKSLEAGGPEIKAYLLSNYFASRYKWNKHHNVTNLLKILERRELLPQLYTKLIPQAFEDFAEGLAISIDDSYHSVEFPPEFSRVSAPSNASQKP